MKLVKKILAVTLASAMVLSLAACGGSQSKTEVTGNETSGAETKAGADSTAKKDKLKVKVCLSTFSDNSFSQSLYEGAVKLKEESSDTVDVEPVEIGTDDTVWVDAFYEAADAGYDVIVGTGYQNAETFANLPKEYPDIKWILFDQPLDFSAGDLPNVLSVLFNSSQSGYLSGAAAAYYSKTGTIAFVGGKDSIVVNEFLVGYIEGAKSVRSDIKVLTAYNGSYTDTANAKSITEAQIAEGADVVFQCAGGSGNGVLEAAAEADGVMSIGVDADQSVTLAGSGYEKAVMTSALKNLGNAFINIINQYAADENSVPFGSEITYGLEIDGVGIVYNDQLTAAIGEENVKKLKDIQSQLADGSITSSTAASMSTDDISALIKSAAE
ncbi:BMP family ABC transporter substrate-binding protein [Clostridium sp. HBUAS56010]|uniref:BMP family lipoprotein n=1 Tax=Clostridium sp. HBUAS56010 TaxID=2571127 RepID=UPI001177EAF3|nr:BMP family ABC transporter substrate-binding protein [Clostridium sp. HBUAS56010]